MGIPSEHQVKGRSRALRARWLVLAVLGLIALAGCRLDLEVDVVVDRNGAGHVQVTVAADNALLNRARAAGAEPLRTLAEHEDLRRTGWMVTIQESAQGEQVVLGSRFSSPEAFTALMGDLAEALAAPELDLLGPITMELREDLIVLDGWAALEPGPAVTEFGLLPEDAVRLAVDHGIIGYVVRFTLPGEVLEHTGDAVDDRVVRWEVAPGERRHLRAEGARPGRALWPFGLAIVALLLVIAAIRRRRRLT